MIDVHTHILPNVDDGCDGVSRAIGLIEDERRAGVTAVVLTPHRRPLTCELGDDEIRSAFDKFIALDDVKATGMGFYLGREIEVYRGMIGDFENGRLISYNGGKYVLVELKYDGGKDVEELVYNITVAGYIPVMAHIERFNYARDIDMIRRIRRRGAIIQINAQSVVDKKFKAEHNFAVKLLKRKLCDAVASDLHFGRKNYLRAAYEKVSKKDSEYAELIFEKNPKKILGVKD